MMNKKEQLAYNKGVIMGYREAVKSIATSMNNYVDRMTEELDKFEKRLK